VGRAPRGTLRLTRPEYMGVKVIKEVLKRTPGLDPMEIDDVIIGCTFPEAEQGLNLGRVLVSKSGLPDEVPGMTVNRFCCSGLNSHLHGLRAHHVRHGRCDHGRRRGIHEPDPHGRQHDDGGPELGFGKALGL
jgi:acetyl-CoA acetyltransferase